MSSYPFAYTLKPSRRARRLSVTVYRTGAVSVTVPPRVPPELVEQFISRKKSWISRKVEEFKARPITETQMILGGKNRRDYLAKKEEALALLSERLAYFNKHYGFAYGTVMIRDQRTRWGSCSRKGSISFNYKLMYLPAELRDYVVVHELCHLKEFNHGPAFWALVAECVPEYRTLRRKLTFIY